MSTPVRMSVSCMYSVSCTHVTRQSDGGDSLRGGRAPMRVKSVPTTRQHGHERSGGNVRNVYGEGPTIRPQSESDVHDGIGRLQSRRHELPSFRTLARRPLPAKERERGGDGIPESGTMKAPSSPPRRREYGYTGARTLTTQAALRRGRAMLSPCTRAPRQCVRLPSRHHLITPSLHPITPVARARQRQPGNGTARHQASCILSEPWEGICRLKRNAK